MNDALTMVLWDLRGRLQARYFFEPVDPVALNSPHPLDSPINLGIIANKAKMHFYDDMSKQNQFAEHVHLVFNNTLMAKCNPIPPMYVAAKELSAIFEARFGVESIQHFPAVKEKFPAASACGHLLAKLVNSDGSSDFLYPIQHHSSSSLPDQFLSPISLVQRKMESGQYMSVRAFASNMYALFRNAAKYNKLQRSSPIFSCAIGLRSLFTEELRLIVRDSRVLSSPRSAVLDTMYTLVNALEHDVRYLDAPDKATATQSMELSTIYERVYTAKYEQWLHAETFIDDVRLMIINAMSSNGFIAQCMAAKKLLAVFEAGLATCGSSTHNFSNSLFHLADQDDIAPRESLRDVVQPLAIATESYLFRKSLDHVSIGIQNHQAVNKSLMELTTTDVKGYCNVATLKLQIALEVKTALTLMTQPRLDALTTPSPTSTNHRVTRMTLMMLLDIVVEDSCAQSYFNRPGNHKVITQPMDLRTIGSRIKKGYYHCVDPFTNDIRLMLANIVQFNNVDPTHPVLSIRVYETKILPRLPTF